jgi:hypothetical protein
MERTPVCQSIWLFWHKIYIDVILNSEKGIL